MIRAANMDHGSKSGISYSIRFGAEDSIDRERRYSIGLQFGTIVIFMLHAVYSAILFVMSRQKTLLVFMFLLLCTALSVAADNDVILSSWVPINYTWGIKIKLLSYLWLVFASLLLTYRFNNGSKPAGKPLRLYLLVLSVYSLYILAFPIKDVLLYAHWIFGVLYNLPAVWMFVLYAKMIYQRKKDTGFLLFSASAIISGVIWGALVNNGEKNLPFYPGDILASIIGFTAYWLKQFFRKSNENLELTLQLMEDNRQKDQFLVQTSQVLKQPLDHILQIARSQTVLVEHSTDSSAKANIGLLVLIGNRMSLLLDDLLDAPLLAEQDIQLQYKKLDLRKTVLDVIDMLRYLVEGKPLNIRVHISEAVPYVYADEKRLFQIMYNLMHNAIKYTEQGDITVEAFSAGGMVKVSITDTGIGMDKATLARIFQPYEQGSQSTEGGIGLGLSISRRLVQLHQSDLAVHSKLNEGSTFYFTLPTVSNTGYKPGKTAAYNAPEAILPIDRRGPSEDKKQTVKKDTNAPLLHDHDGSSPRILIITDDPVNQKVVANILAEENYRMTAVSSVHEALALLRSLSWDLLIADVKMSPIPGDNLTSLVRQHFNVTELPILLLISNMALDGAYKQFLQGANDYVIKPIEGLELKYRVQTLIALKQSIDQSLHMETAYLQAQIKPHFLFNAINSIMALSEFDMEQMRKVAGAFSDYLRYSVDFINSSQLVDLQSELSLVKAYLFIEKVRFEDRLTVIWDIAPELQFMLPPLSVQPLVENAVRHGLLSRARGGELVIRISQEETAACIEIIDNGKGMTEAEIETILSHPQDGNGGIGLRNTNRRLFQRYGHGLRIQSEPGEGTKVSFSIPLNA
ncbi:ATP-binding protein [Paenibacillus sp. FSL R7-0273]|uniref:hybrid sensor histidine kinase/response regulator n=1 Tax=Paenibacillus sp. FSL R7-0273 TaxID=1536772 RepID=UPI0015C2CE45|nr:ATP-binding protein [Paenibacillus sp. FSL R7-0273]